MWTSERFFNLKLLKNFERSQELKTKWKIVDLEFLNIMKIYSCCSNLKLNYHQSLQPSNYHFINPWVFKSLFTITTRIWLSRFNSSFTHVWNFYYFFFKKISWKKKKKENLPSFLRFCWGWVETETVIVIPSSKSSTSSKTCNFPFSLNSK